MPKARHHRSIDEDLLLISWANGWEGHRGGHFAIESIDLRHGINNSKVNVIVWEIVGGIMVSDGERKVRSIQMGVALKGGRVVCRKNGALVYSCQHGGK